MNYNLCYLNRFQYSLAKLFRGGDVFHCFFFLTKTLNYTLLLKYHKAHIINVFALSNFNLLYLSHLYVKISLMNININWEF